MCMQVEKSWALEVLSELYIKQWMDVLDRSVSVKFVGEVRVELHILDTAN